MEAAAEEEARIEAERIALMREAEKIEAEKAAAMAD